VLSTVSPNTGAQGATLASVSLSGNFTHWVQNTTTATFGAGISVNSLTVNSATSATASLTISPTASTGSNNVTLTTSGEIVTLTNGFTITAGPAAISSIVSPRYKRRERIDHRRLHGDCRNADHHVD
jgi:hypothetical protein